MIGMSVILDGDNAWPDLADESGFTRMGDGGAPIKVAVLAGGMASGRPSIAMRLDLPSGEIVIAETSARLFCSAARIIMARYPDLFDDERGPPQ